MLSRSGSADPKTIIVCMPVFNDWGPASELLRRIDSVAKESPFCWRVLYVDDGSTDQPPTTFNIPLEKVIEVEILQLRTNLGHQRAIAVGLSFIQEKRPCDMVVVMDADGQDLPEDIPKLVETASEQDNRRIIFAKRERRTEGLVFRFFYLLYKLLHFLTTFRKIEVGNFSIVPFEHLNRLVAVPDMWNHYPASVFRARIPYGTTPIARGKRIEGNSRMNFISLVSHGLGAMSVYAEEIGVRLLVGTGLLGGVLAVALLVFLIFEMRRGFEFPSWATLAAVCFWITLLQLFVISTIFIFVALRGRTSMEFLPIRDYHHFVLRVFKVPVDG